MSNFLLFNKFSYGGVIKEDEVIDRDGGDEAGD